MRLQIPDHPAGASSSVPLVWPPVAPPLALAFRCRRQMRPLRQRTGRCRYSVASALPFKRMLRIAVATHARSSPRQIDGWPRRHLPVSEAVRRGSKPAGSRRVFLVSYPGWRTVVRHAKPGSDDVGDRHSEVVQSDKGLWVHPARQWRQGRVRPYFSRGEGWAKQPQ
jgi:hypothetical protein